MGQTEKQQRGKRSADENQDELLIRVLPATAPGRTHALHVGQVIPAMILWRAATVLIFRSARGDTTHSLTPLIDVCHYVKGRGQAGTSGVACDARFRAEHAWCITRGKCPL